jgi:hypothetical protein
MSVKQSTLEKKPKTPIVEEANRSFRLILGLIPLNVRKAIGPHVANIAKILGPLDSELEDRRGKHWKDKRNASDPRLTKVRY